MNFTWKASIVLRTFGIVTTVPFILGMRHKLKYTLPTHTMKIGPLLLPKWMTNGGIFWRMTLTSPTLMNGLAFTLTYSPTQSWFFKAHLSIPLHTCINNNSPCLSQLNILWLAHISDVLANATTCLESSQGSSMQWKLFSPHEFKGNKKISFFYGRMGQPCMKPISLVAGWRVLFLH